MAPTSPAAVPHDAADSAEDVAAQALADERQVEFRARHQLTIDAQAHTLLEPRYAREMRAVPSASSRDVPSWRLPTSERRPASIRDLVAGEPSSCSWRPSHSMRC